MKIFRLFLIFTCIFSVNHSISQNFTLSELIKLKKMNADEFDTYVVKKGYEFYRKHPDDKNHSILINYSYKINGARRCYITKKTFKFGEEQVIFQTTSSKSYLSIKNELSVLGFKLSETVPSEDFNGLKYLKGNLMVVLISRQYEDETDHSTTAIYEIIVSD